VANQTVTLQQEPVPAPAPIPVKNALYIMNEATLQKSFITSRVSFAGWNGAATAGATLVAATGESVHGVGRAGAGARDSNGELAESAHRTSVDFTGSFGKITEPWIHRAAVPPATTADVCACGHDKDRESTMRTRSAMSI